MKSLVRTLLGLASMAGFLWSTSTAVLSSPAAPLEQALAAAIWKLDAEPGTHYSYLVTSSGDTRYALVGFNINEQSEAPNEIWLFTLWRYRHGAWTLVDHAGGSIHGSPDVTGVAQRDGFPPDVVHQFGSVDESPDVLRAPPFKTIQFTSNGRVKP